MSKNFYVKRAKEMGPKNPKPKKSVGREYSDGYLSRSSLASAMGVKQRGGWGVIQRALNRCGYTMRGTPTPKAEGLHRIHIDLNEETGDQKEWLVWSPEMKSLLREAVDYLLTVPAGTEKPQPGDRTYPEGFTSVTKMAELVDSTPALVRAYLIKWGFAKQTKDGLVPDENGEECAMLYEEAVAGRISKWYVWNISTLAGDMKRYLAEHPEFTA